MDKPVLPWPLWKRLFLFGGLLTAVIVVGSYWGASPEQRRRMRKRLARFAGF